jgi:hypothetical protein
MRYGVTADNVLERGLMAAGVLPTAMTEGYAPVYAKASWPPPSAGCSTPSSRYRAPPKRFSAGLVPRKPSRLPFAREVGLQAADRP